MILKRRRRGFETRNEAVCGRKETDDNKIKAGGWKKKLKMKEELHCREKGMKKGVLGEGR